MIIDTIRLVGTESISLPITGSPTSRPFVFKGAEGLDAPEIAIRMYRGPGEKAYYQGRMPALRQLIFLIGLEPNWGIGEVPGDLRDQLYSMLSPRYGQSIRVDLMQDGNVVAFTRGHVTNMESAIFSKDPAVRIVLECEEPYFSALQQIKTQPAQVAGPGGLRAFEVENVGSAPTGFLAGIKLGADVGTFMSLGEEHVGGRRIEVEGVTWNAGDTFIVDTNYESRGVWRMPAGTQSMVSVLNNLRGSSSDWIQLHKGLNRLIVSTISFSWDATRQFTYRPKYWGV